MGENSAGEKYFTSVSWVVLPLARLGGEWHPYSPNITSIDFISDIYTYSMDAVCHASIVSLFLCFSPI